MHVDTIIVGKGPLCTSDRIKRKHGILRGYRIAQTTEHGARQNDRERDQLGSSLYLEGDGELWKDFK
jgi:hypothetical protein